MSTVNIDEIEIRNVLLGNTFAVIPPEYFIIRTVVLIIRYINVFKGIFGSVINRKDNILL